LWRLEMATKPPTLDPSLVPNLALNSSTPLTKYQEMMRPEAMLQLRNRPLLPWESESLFPEGHSWAQRCLMMEKDLDTLGKSLGGRGDPLHRAKDWFHQKNQHFQREAHGLLNARAGEEGREVVMSPLEGVRPLPSRIRPGVAAYRHDRNLYLPSTYRKKTFLPLTPLPIK